MPQQGWADLPWAVECGPFSAIHHRAALDWVDKLEAKCLLIAENPFLGELQPRLGVGVRSSVVGRYVIFHREANDRVETLRVIPGDRDIRRF